MILRNNRAIGGNRSSYGGYGAGGGVAIEAEVNADIPVTMEDTLFENNQALGGGGGDRGGLALGGGIFAYNAYIVMTDVIVRNNRQTWRHWRWIRCRPAGGCFRWGNSQIDRLTLIVFR
jgi:hypothetical protein